MDGVTASGSESLRLGESIRLHSGPAIAKASLLEKLAGQEAAARLGGQMEWQRMTSLDETQQGQDGQAQGEQSHVW
jgi:hypothetical protein